MQIQHFDNNSLIYFIFSNYDQNTFSVFLQHILFYHSLLKYIKITYSHSPIIISEHFNQLHNIVKRGMVLSNSVVQCLLVLCLNDSRKYCDKLNFLEKVEKNVYLNSISNKV